LRLARRGARVSAVDHCPEMLSVAAERATQENLDIDFRLRSLEDRLPFYQATFDLIMCSLTLTHVPCLKETLLEFHRVLRPRGHLLITDFHPDGVQLGWRTEFVKEHLRYQLPNMPYTRSDYIGALESAGFSIVEVIDVPLRSVPSGYLPQDEIADQGHVNFCIIILAGKGG
jgi:ubiquinone/menaquinone biosynthesis C-methylase UbiE